MLILALDPGQCTGYAIAHKDSESLFICCGQEYLDPQQFWRFLNETLPKAEQPFVVCESFEFRQGKQHAGIDLYPRELIGILKLHRYFDEERLFFQPAYTQGKKAYFSDTRLKDMELYRKGTEHGRSAVKHLLHWLYHGPGYQYIASERELKPELVEEEWLRRKYLAAS